MTWNGLQRRTLEINLARDRAEALLTHLRQLQAEARQRPRSADHAHQRQVGDLAMLRSIAAAERMLDNLNGALKVARRELFQMPGELGRGKDDTGSSA